MAGGFGPFDEASYGRFLVSPLATPFHGVPWLRFLADAVGGELRAVSGDGFVVPLVVRRRRPFVSVSALPLNAPGHPLTLEPRDARVVAATLERALSRVAVAGLTDASDALVPGVEPVSFSPRWRREAFLLPVLSPDAKPNRSRRRALARAAGAGVSAEERVSGADAERLYPLYERERARLGGFGFSRGPFGRLLALADEPGPFGAALRVARRGERLVGFTLSLTSPRAEALYAHGLSADAPEGTLTLLVGAAADACRERGALLLLGVTDPAREGELAFKRSFGARVARVTRWHRRSLLAPFRG